MGAFERAAGPLSGSTGAASDDAPACGVELALEP